MTKTVRDAVYHIVLIRYYRHSTKLAEDEPEKETLKKLIHEFPSCLQYKNGINQIPIHSAVWHDDTVGYVPLLVEQGIEHNVGRNDKRGGLLVIDPHFSILNGITQHHHHKDMFTYRI